MNLGSNGASIAETSFNVFLRHNVDAGRKCGCIQDDHASVVGIAKWGGIGPCGSNLLAISLNVQDQTLGYKRHALRW